MLQRKISFYVIVLLLTITATNFIYAINQTVPPEMQKLTSKLLGKWNAVLTLKMDGKEMSVKDVCNFTQVSDGQGIYMTENFSMDNGTVIKGVNLIGYDADKDVIHWYTVSSVGETIDNIVKWTDDDSFTITYNGTMNNKPYSSVFECEFVKDGYCDVRQIAKVNNAVSQEMTGQFVRE